MFSLCVWGGGSLASTLQKHACPCVGNCVWRCEEPATCPGRLGFLLFTSQWQEVEADPCITDSRTKQLLKMDGYSKRVIDSFGCERAAGRDHTARSGTCQKPVYSALCLPTID